MVMYIHTHRLAREFCLEAVTQDKVVGMLQKVGCDA